MDLFEDISRAYLAVQVTQRLSEQLSQAQRDIYELASADNRKVQSLPKDALTIPLIDLGDIKRPALEATQLAMERALAAKQPFEVTLGTIDMWPDTAAPQLMQVSIATGEDKLQALRADMAAELERYGFEIRAGTWQGHLPISRLRGDGPQFAAPEVTWNEAVDVRSVVVLVRREDRRGRMRFFVDGEFSFSEATADAADTLDEDAIRAEIRTQLEERLSQRGTMVRPPRRRLRVKDIEDTIDVDADSGEAESHL